MENTLTQEEETCEEQEDIILQCKHLGLIY